jgi:pyruvate,water dikinase
MQYFLNFEEISSKHLRSDLIGGKALYLVKLYQNNFPIPNGFIITSEFFNYFLSENKPIEFSEENIRILNQYIDKCNPSGLVAIRSSASIEDLKNKSYAGQFDSFLNIEKNKVPEMIKRCWNSIYNTRVKQYAGDEIADIRMAVIVQKMIVSEISGVAFSKSPLGKDNDLIVIEASSGSGELLVQGKITPDLYTVDRNFTIRDKKIISDGENRKQKLSDNQIIEIAKLVTDIANFFGFEVDVEWTISRGKFYILQSRPITIIQ